jgi:MFS family permease
MSRLSRPAAVALGLSFVVLLVTGGARHAIGLVMKPMVDEFGWGRGTLGWTIAIFLTVSAMAMFVSGRMADRLSPRLVLGAGIAISTVGIGLMAFIDAAWQALLLYGVVFAIGNGVAAITPVGVMITRLFPNRAGLANAFAISGMGLGQLIIISGLAVVLVGMGWRSVFFWLGLLHAVLLPILLIGAGGGGAATGVQPANAASGVSMSFGEAIRTRRFAILAAVYAVCGFQDFFVATHVVAFALDQGADTLLAGNLLAFMGLAGLVGVVVAGLWSDRSGPLAPTVACFVLRVAIFGLIALDKSVTSVALFALAFGVTYWITAPLTVVFVRDAFGMANLGALTGLITMIHHICGGLGALIGALWFDSSGSYHGAFVTNIACSLVALLLLVPLRASAARA